MHWCTFHIGTAGLVRAMAKKPRWLVPLKADKALTWYCNHCRHTHAISYWNHPQSLQVKPLRRQQTETRTTRRRVSCKWRQIRMNSLVIVFTLENFKTKMLLKRHVFKVISHVCVSSQCFRDIKILHFWPSNGRPRSRCTILATDAIRWQMFKSTHVYIFDFRYDICGRL